MAARRAVEPILNATAGLVSAVLIVSYDWDPSLYSKAARFQYMGSEGVRLKVRVSSRSDSVSTYWSRVMSWHERACSLRTVMGQTSLNLVARSRSVPASVSKLSSVGGRLWAMSLSSRAMERKRVLLLKPRIFCARQSHSMTALRWGSTRLRAAKTEARWGVCVLGWEWVRAEVGLGRKWESQFWMFWANMFLNF